MKLAIAIIHGIGIQEPGYSKKLQAKLTSLYEKQNPQCHAEDLIFTEIYWDDILRIPQQLLFQRIDYKFDLDYSISRHFFINYLGDAIAYQPARPDRDNDHRPTYDLIHERVRSSLLNLAEHPDIDPLNTPLFFIGHSLGTVILSNYIWDKQKFDERDFTHCHTLGGLFTLGSPLAFWSLRFNSFGKPINFPGKGLPADLQACAKWYNFYDKHDIIATPLKKLTPEYADVVSDDIQVRVGGLFFSWNPLSHLKYWQDKRVLKTIAKCLLDFQEQRAN